MICQRATVKYNGHAVVLFSHRDAKHAGEVFDLELALDADHLEALAAKALERWRTGKRRPATAARGGIKLRVVGRR